MAVDRAPEERLGFLRSCLVEGDSAQEQRVRRSKQRALLLSILFQILIVAALVLFPLFTKGENIATRVISFPAVPYVRGSSHPRQTASQPTPRSHHPVCAICQQPNRIPTAVVTLDVDPVADPGDSNVTSIPGVPEGANIPGISPSIDSHREPPPPATHPRTAGPRRISEPVIAARLIRRVEPIYPIIGRQLGREGRVELRAIIATDGSIQALEVISGDPLFIQSALAAVREWRYQPTLLDGQPVEVDTHITVIYTLAH